MTTAQHEGAENALPPMLGSAKWGLRTHIMLQEPFEIVSTGVGPVPLQKALCGQKEPWSQARGTIRPTCKRCVKIWRSGRHGKLASGFTLTLR